MQQPVAQPAESGNLVQKLLVGGALFGGTLLGKKYVYQGQAMSEPWAN
jgi:hypothetical protein